jgi:hypothetical protein
MTVTPDDVRALLSDDDPTAVLVLVEGRTEVVPAESLDTADYRGALRIASRDDVIDRTDGEEPSEHDLAERAAALNAEIDNLGG